MHSLGTRTPKLDGPGRRCEREADRIAERVLRMPAPARVDAAGGTSQRGNGRLGRSEQTETMLHGVPAAAPRLVGETLSSPGRPLDAATRTFMEPRLGSDFSRVRVHTDTKAAESTRAVNALAYTVGPDIAFATGAFGPDTGPGRRLLAHELAHVVQQSRVGVARLQRYEGPEHQDIGDRYPRELLAFLQTPEGARWAQERGLDRNALVAQMQADPLLHGGKYSEVL